jgi:glucokinase
MAEPSKAEYVVGVDLGGTKILSGVFNSSFECIATAKLSTKSQRGVAKVIERVARCVKDAVDEADLSMKQIAGVGIGAPGAVDHAAGTVIFAPNMEGWKDVPLRKELEKELGVPVAVENDCNIAALGVYVGELKGKPRSMLGIFVGTGIGGGLIVNGELYSGFGHTAGEVGHMVLEVSGPKCGCGNKGCFEALASRTAIFQQIKAGIKNGQKTLLTDMLGNDLSDLRSGDLRKAIRRGDKFVDKVVEEAAEYIGIATANLVNILNPEVVVLGGGVIEALEGEMMGVIVETAQDYAMPGSMKNVEIVASQLGDNAGITGGAVLARKKKDEGTKVKE